MDKRKDVRRWVLSYVEPQLRRLEIFISHGIKDKEIWGNVLEG